jgi:hypothetical protein
LILSETKIEGIVHSVPWIYISLLPNFFFDWDNLFIYSKTGKAFSVIVVQKKVDFAACIGNVPKHLCKIILQMTGTCIEIQMKQKGSEKYVRLYNWSFGSVHRMQRVDLNHEYSILVSCGYIDSIIELSKDRPRL